MCRCRLCRCTALRPLQKEMWRHGVKALHRLGSAQAVLGWLPAEESLGGKAGAAAALLGNLAQVAGACLAVHLCTSIAPFSPALSSCVWLSSLKLVLIAPHFKLMPRSSITCLISFSCLAGQTTLGRHALFCCSIHLRGRVACVAGPPAEAF